MRQLIVQLFREFNLRAARCPWLQESASVVLQSIVRLDPDTRSGFHAVFQEGFGRYSERQHLAMSNVPKFMFDLIDE